VVTQTVRGDLTETLRLGRASRSRTGRDIEGFPRWFRESGLFGLSVTEVGVGRAGELVGLTAARLKSEPDKRYLQWESDPVEHLRCQVVALLGGEGILQVGRPDRRQEHGRCYARPSGPAPEPDCADDLTYAAGVDERLCGRGACSAPDSDRDGLAWRRVPEINDGVSGAVRIVAVGVAGV
jgi:hypothetical protein